MPRAGGESNKLGNGYEDLWTVDSLLDVLTGEAIEMLCEPHDDPIGIEFAKLLPTGVQEFHSVKRQHPKGGWTFSALTKADSKGRSVLGDLLGKKVKLPSCRLVFVSGTIAASVQDLWDRASRCKTFEDLANQFKSSTVLLSQFQEHILPLVGNDPSRAFELVKSLRMVSIGESELKRQLTQKFGFLFYKKGSYTIDGHEIVLKLGDFVNDNLGRKINTSEIREHLSDNGYLLRDWAFETAIHNQIAKLNAEFLRPLIGDLILGNQIPRREAVIAFDTLKSDSKKFAQIIVGTAGMGKSIAAAQVVQQLIREKIPVLAIRLDNVSNVSNTRELGEDFNLPLSPVYAVAGLSLGNLGVLVVDQLDALSATSGRNRGLWKVFYEILEEISEHPNLRLVLTCRAFDLGNDPELEKLVANEGPAARLDLTPLSAEVVGEILKSSGFDLKQLSPREQQLLQSPLHLNLFVQGLSGGGSVSFGGVQELFNRFWRAKRDESDAKGGHFEKVVGILTDLLSRYESLHVQEEKLDEVSKDAEVLASLNVLILENRNYRFFHEAFFDYAFARRFMAQGSDLIIFLTQECGEQHLFRRSQVRQIFSYQRERNPPVYLKWLETFLNHDEIRLHLKQLVIDWLSQLEVPFEEEWNIIFPLLTNERLRWTVFGIFWGRMPWFDLLLKIQVFPRLLKSLPTPLRDQCLRGLTQKNLLEQRSPELAQIFTMFRDEKQFWNSPVKQIFYFGDFHHSKEMFTLAIHLQNEGFFDEHTEIEWLHFADMAERTPALAIEFLESALERMIFKSSEAHVSNPFADEKSRIIDPSFIQLCAQKDPVAFAKRISPIVKKLVLANAKKSTIGDYHDDIWEFGVWREAEYETTEALLGSVMRAIKATASLDPEQCSNIIKGWDDLNHQTIWLIVLSAYLGNPNYFASAAVPYLIKQPRSCWPQYDHLTLPLIEALGSIVDTGLLQTLEEALENFSPSYEDGDLDNRGRQKQKLLMQLSAQKLSPRAKTTLQQLEEKFGNALPASQPMERKFGFVAPPIVASEFQTMSDGQLETLFRRHNKLGSWLDKGQRIEGAGEFQSALRKAASEQKDRFASLALKLSPDILPVYLEFILAGILDNSSDGPSAEMAADYLNQQSLPIDTILLVIDKLCKLPGSPCALAISEAVRALDKKSVPFELAKIIAELAVSGFSLEKPPSAVSHLPPGPITEDPFNEGIMSVQGNAAFTLSQLLFDHREFSEQLLPYIEKLCKSISIGTRATNIRSLIALLRTHRDEAVKMFIENISADEALWVSDGVRDFIYYSATTHYSSLRIIIGRMTESANSKVKARAAEQVVLAAFKHSDARADLTSVLQGDELCRSAAAKIYAVNVHNESVREKCLEQLVELFQDSEFSVREAASRWFRDKVGDWTTWQRELLSKFIQSKAFIDCRMDCMHALTKPGVPTPPAVLNLITRALDIFQNEEIPDSKAFRFTSSLPGMTLRLYETTSDEHVKRKCLDEIDRLIVCGLGMDRELSNAERGAG